MSYIWDKYFQCFFSETKPGFLKVTEVEPNMFNLIIQNTRSRSENLESRSENLETVLYWCQGFPNITPPICIVCIFFILSYLHFRGNPLMNLTFFQPFIASWITQICLTAAKLTCPYCVQYTSNIEFSCQKWHWCCDWQWATHKSHMRNKPLVCCNGYNPTKPLIRLYFKYKTVSIPKLKKILYFRYL